MAVATYGISCAMAMRGRFLPVPNALPIPDATGRVLAVLAPAGVAPERCTPVFMYPWLS